MSKANPRFHRHNAPLPNLSVPAYRVTGFYSVDNQICLISQDYVMTANAQGPTSEGNIAATWATTCLNAIRSALAADCFFDQVKVECLTTPSRLPAIATINPASQAGLVAGTHLPSEVAVILSKATSTKGQHGRGRLYPPGIPSSFVTPATDPNRLNGGGNTAFVALATALQNPAIADGVNVCIAAVTTRVPQGAPVTQGQALTGIFVRELFGVIRRRRIGRGK